MRILAVLLSVMIAMMPSTTDAYKFLELSVNEKKKLPTRWKGTHPTIRVALVREANVEFLNKGYGNCRTMQSLESLLAASEIHEQDFISEVRIALSMWSGVANVRLEYVDDERAAQIRIGATPNLFGMAYADVAIRDLDEYTNEIYEGGICFSSRYLLSRTTGDCSRTLNIRYVLLHEIGHVLGLDHTEIASAVMDYRCTQKNAELTKDDIDGLTAVYGEPEKTPTN